MTTAIRPHPLRDAEAEIAAASGWPEPTRLGVAASTRTPKADDRSGFDAHPLEPLVVP